MDIRSDAGACGRPSASFWVSPHWMSMLHVTEIHTRVAFLALEAEWNALVQSTHNAVYERHEFFRIFMDTFYPDWNGIRYLIALDHNRIKAILPMVESRAPLYGLPTHRLSALVSYYFPRFDMIASDPDAASE